MGGIFDSVSAKLVEDDTASMKTILTEKTTLVSLLTDAIPRTTENRQLFKKNWIHAARHLITDTDGKEVAWEFPMVRVTDIC